MHNEMLLSFSQCASNIVRYTIKILCRCYRCRLIFTNPLWFFNLSLSLSLYEWMWFCRCYKNEHWKIELIKRMTSDEKTMIVHDWLCMWGYEREHSAQPWNCAKNLFFSDKTLRGNCILRRYIHLGMPINNKKPTQIMISRTWAHTHLITATA